MDHCNSVALAQLYLQDVSQLDPNHGHATHAHDESLVHSDVLRSSNNQICVVPLESKPLDLANSVHQSDDMAFLRHHTMGHDAKNLQTSHDVRAIHVSDQFQCICGLSWD